MNCQEFEELIHLRLDGEAIGAGLPDEDHLSKCPACRDLFAAVQGLEKGFRLLDRPAPPVGLAERIVAQVLSERRSRIRRRQRWLVSAALAAALFLAVLLGNSWLRWGRGRTQPAPIDPPLAAVPAPIDSPAAKRQAKPEVAVSPLSLNKSVGEAGSALVALVSWTADETVGQSRLLLPTLDQPPSMAGVDVWQQALEPPAQSLREAGQGVSLGFEPVANSARRAVNLFLRDIP